MLSAVLKCSLYPLLLGVICLHGSGNAQGSRRLVVGYYPSWAKTAYPYTVIPYQHLTHIAHAFIGPTSSGGLDVPSEFLYPQLIQEAHSHDVKVLVSLGGWGDYSTRFSPMAADTGSRRRFVTALVDFCRANGYDGADLDWEYPASDADRANLSALATELRVAFDGVVPRLLLAMAGPSTGWSGKWFDYESMQDDFDWIGIMTYDYHGSWTSTSGPNAPLYGDNWVKNTQGWADYSVDYYNVTRGIPKAKLLIGVPFYGWLFNASTMYGASTGASQLTFAAIRPKLSQGWVRSWDATGQVPYLTSPTGTQVLSYDDSLSVALKCGYVKGKGVGGVIIWALGQDYIGGDQTLLNVVGKELSAFSATDIVSARTLPHSSVLQQSYPNPFNPVTTLSYLVGGERIQGWRANHVRLVVFDLLGRELSVLVDEHQAAGGYEVRFDGSRLSSGVYAYRLTVCDEDGGGAGAFVQTKMMLLAK